MKIRIITVGKTRDKNFRAAADEYASRLKHYTPIELVAVKDDKQALAKIDPTDHLIICDKEGRQHTSEDVAGLIDWHRMNGTKRMVFFVGGPEGVSDEMKKRTGEWMSFSKMTFPHELALVMLLEQLYRAHTILKGEPYHK
jgi:23S rRNA (pseudouridine1915-N3)-methyltransferase